MFSRRAWRRAERERRGLPLEAAGLKVLIQANELQAAGQAAQAAVLYAQLAQRAQARGRPRRAAQLGLETARSLAASGDGRGALTQALAALTLLVEAGRARKAQRLFPPLVADLRQRGFVAEADELQRQLAGRLGGAAASLEAEPAPALPRGRLPAKCPGCGGPVRGDEVEWIEPDPRAPANPLPAAECPYCGSVLYIEE